MGIPREEIIDGKHYNLQENGLQVLEFLGLTNQVIFLHNQHRREKITHLKVKMISYVRMISHNYLHIQIIHIFNDLKIGFILLEYNGIKMVGFVFLST